MVRRNQPQREAGAQGGARNRHDPVVKCVARAIKRVLQLIKTRIFSDMEHDFCLVWFLSSIWFLVFVQYMVSV